MASPERTQWYPVSVKPVRVGWYEYVYQGDASSAIRALWDGDCWLCHLGIGSADLTSMVVFMSDQWRGLAEPPK